MGRPPLLHLLLAELPQLVHRRRFPRDDALRDLGELPDNRPVRDGIVCRGHLDPDDANPGVILSAVMDPVAQITQPRLQVLTVVLLDQRPVRDDAGLPAD